MSDARDLLSPPAPPLEGEIIPPGANTDHEWEHEIVAGHTWMVRKRPMRDVTPGREGR